ncbi:MAG: hypothetical protein A3F16_08310 [Deltaproteobacteria bacterium RIFCSPHIGHO2_12_FULL_43_9]|nr:MAG: hypothetical protein A3F16_08310 [Deltaproteobacteria bacterium RIFCSPHIGHO2_12_FULL_43_9]
MKEIIKHVALATIVLVTLLLLLGKIVNADNENRPEEAQIAAVEYAGSGCKNDAVTANISEDFGTLQINFPSFSAQLGPGFSKGDHRKFCQVVLDIRHSEGWQYSLSNVDFILSSKLDRDINAEVGGLFYFQGDEAEELKHLFSGPVEFTLHAKVPLQTNWSSCEKTRALNIKGIVKVGLKDPENNEGRGELTLIGPTTFGIEWRRCE